MSTPARDTDPQAFQVRLDSLTPFGEVSPARATPWVVWVTEELEPLVEIGVVQVLRADHDLLAATADLFGANIARTVAASAAAQQARLGDLFVAQAMIREPRPDSDLLTVYGLLRAMEVLRAPAVHFLWPVLSERSADLLHADVDEHGGTVLAETASALHGTLLEALLTSRRGMSLAPPPAR